MKNNNATEQVKKIFSRCHRCNSKRLKYAGDQVIIDPITEKAETHESMVCMDCTSDHFIENGQIAFQWDKQIGDFSQAQIHHCPSDYEVAMAEKEDVPVGRISGHDK